MANIHKVALLFDTAIASSRSILKGVARYSRLYGPWMFYREEPIYLPPRKTKKTLTSLREFGVNGIITRSPKGLEEMLTLGVPVICASKPESSSIRIPHIESNDAAVGKMGAEHFLERNFKNVAFVGFDEMLWSRQRRESFQKTVQKAGLKMLSYKGLKEKHLQTNDQIQLAEWLNSLPKPIGVMACADYLSEQILEACFMADLHVPEEVAILGVDDDEMTCNLSYLPLSSISLNYSGAGYEAASLLDKLITKGHTTIQKIIVEPQSVTTRLSTDIFAIKDSEVLAAIRFIHQHANQLISVDNVVETTNLSRRSLEHRFNSTLGRSIHKEIMHVHVDRICQMLTKTELPISLIAQKLNHTNTEYISRLFKREKGISPLEYRKKYALGSYY